jgi:endonuclease I
MHAIFAAHSSVNGSRGNIPFGEVGKLLKEDNYGKIYCQNKTKYYSPNINKGALARASLYILVCYKNSANS